LRITYAIDQDTGYVWSRVGSQVAVPIIDFDKMGPADAFAIKAHLERMDVLAVTTDWRMLRWTRKIPVHLKNLHRAFWGMKPLQVPQ
jgi:hypothetical protein